MKKMLTFKKNDKDGEEDAVYSEELILDGVTAFSAMTKWMWIYFKENPKMKLGELIGNMCFIEGGTVDRFECWELWEKVVKESIKERNTPD